MVRVNGGWKLLVDNDCLWERMNQFLEWSVDEAVRGEVSLTN